MGQETVLGIRINVNASSAGPAASEASAALNKVKTDLGNLEQRFGTLSAAQQKYVLGQYQAMQSAAGNGTAVRALQAAMQGFNSTQIETLVTMGKVTDETKKGQQSSESMFASFVKGIAVVEIAKQAFDALVGVYKEAREQSRQMQQDDLRVQAVLEATGRGVEGLRGRVQSLATGMQEATGVSDSAVKASAASLATYTGIVGASFERTITLASDLAAVFGGDLKSRTEQIARALTEPEQALGQLERQFGKFNPTIKAQITDLMAMNEVAAAQTLILDELAGRVGGAAVNAYTGLERQIVGTQNAWEDLVRALGNQIFDAKSKEAGVLEVSLRNVEAALNDNLSVWGKVQLAAASSPLAGMAGWALGMGNQADRRAVRPEDWDDTDGRDRQAQAAATAAAAAEEKVLRAAEGINKIIEATRDKRSRLNDELARVNKLTTDRLLMAGSAEESAKIIADMEAATAGLQRKYAETRTNKKAKIEEMQDTSAQWAKAALEYALGTARADLEAVKGYLDETGKAIEDAHKAGLISEADYWEKKAQLVEDGVAANEVALEAELDALYTQQNELIAARTKAGNNAKEVDRINLQLVATDLKVLEVGTKLDANQRKLGDAMRLRGQGAQAATDAQRKFYEEVQRAVEPERQQLEALQRANEQWGMTPVQIAQANVALAESNLQMALSGQYVAADTEAWEKNVEIMRQRLEIARSGVGAASVRSDLEASTKATEVQTAAIRDLWQSTEQAAKGFWDIMVDGAGNTAQRLKDAFKRLFFDWIWNEFAKKQVMNLFISATGVSATQANAAGLFSGTSGNGMTSFIDGVGNWIGGLFGSGGGAGGAGNLGGTIAGGATSAWGAASGSAGGNWLTTLSNTFSSGGTGGNWLSTLGSLFSSSGTAGQWLSQIGGWFGIGGGAVADLGGTIAGGASSAWGSAASSTGAGFGSVSGLSGAIGTVGIGAIIGGFLGPMVSKDERAGTAGAIGGAAGAYIGAAAAAWLVGAEAGSIAGPIGTIIGAVIGAVIGALSTGDGIAQRVAKFVTGSGKDYTYQGKSQFGEFGIERGSDQWFSDDEMKVTLDGWMQSIALLDNSIAAHLTTAQIGQVQGALGGTGGSTYGFGMEHQDIPGGTFGAIVRERYTAVFSVLDVEMSKMIAGFEGTTEDLLKLIGDLTTVHFTLEQRGAAIAAVIGEGLDITKLQAMNKEGETYTETMTRLVEVFMVTNEVARSMGKTVEEAFGGVGLSTEKVRQQLIDYAGGIDNLQGLLQSYYQNYFSAEERAAMLLDDVKKGFELLGIEMPLTKDEFQALVEGLDLTKQADAAFYVELMKLAPGFAAVTDSAAAAAEAAIDAAKADADRAKAQAEEARALAQVGAVIAATMGTTSSALFGVGAAGQAAMEGLAGLVGGTQNLANLINGYQQSYLSAQERYVVNLGDVRDKFAELGVEMPTTKAGFSALIEGLDLTTEHDRVLYAALLQLAPQFASVADYAEQMRAKTQQLLDGMQAYIDFDPAAAIAAAMNPQSLTQQWQASGVELRRVMALHDGTEASQQRIAQAVQNRYQTELQLVQAIADALNGIQGLASDTIRSMTLQTLDNPGKYAFYDAEIVSLRAQLAVATDPAEIASLNQRIIQNINAAFQLLSPEEQQAKLAEFTARIDTISAEATARLESTGATISAEHTSIPDSIKNAIESSMKTIAEAFNKAADGMGAAVTDFGKVSKESADIGLEAANLLALAAATPTQVNVGISVQDDRVTTEVN